MSIDYQLEHKNKVANKQNANMNRLLGEYINKYKNDK